MKFFPGLLKALAAGGAAGVVVLVQQVVAYFQGAAPSDVSASTWMIVSTLAVFLLNFLISKLPPRA